MDKWQFNGSSAEYSAPDASDIERYMREALNEALIARDAGEIPVGAVIVQGGRIIGRGHNSTETLHDTTAHAEILAIRQASLYLGETLGWRRLTGCDLYVTMEPCAMCAGAMVWARIEHCWFAVRDLKAGACGSIMNVASEPKFNHQVETIELADGPLKDECRETVQEFFRNIRSLKKMQKAAANADPDGGSC